jgi:hypothetical protein
MFFLFSLQTKSNKSTPSTSKMSSYFSSNPSFFPSKPSPQELYNTPYWPIIAIVVAVFLTRTEIGSQNCSHIRDGRQLCNHDSPLPSEYDLPDETIDKMIRSLRRHHTVVGWRRAMLISIILSIIILIWLNDGRMVHGLVFFVTTMIIFVVVYFTSVWFQSKWFSKNDSDIEKSLRHLESLLDE